MERLSEKLTDVLRECIDALSQVEEDIIKMTLNRLAAYEDTGLEPEDIKKAFNEDALLKMTAQYLGTTPDRLREWAKAEKEGRLVVLPCKVGDTVWYIDGGYYKPKEFCKVSRPHQIVEISYKLQRRSGKILEGFITDNGTRYSFNGIGKTVFLTREEAEAALAGERKDGEG